MGGRGFDRELAFRSAPHAWSLAMCAVYAFSPTEKFAHLVGTSPTAQGRPDTSGGPPA
jgi:hypothetical protein